MGKLSILLTLVVSFLISSCVTMQKGKEFAYDNNDGRALVAFNHRSLYDDGTIKIRKIDLSKNQFVGPEIEVISCSGCLDFDAAFYLESGSVPEFIFTFLSSGHYSFLGSSYFLNEKEFICNAGTIFEVKAGRITFIELPKNGKSNFGQFRRLKSVIASYPKINAELIEGQLAEIDSASTLRVKNRLCN